MRSEVDLKSKTKKLKVIKVNSISDEDKSVHKMYGTWVEKKMYGRTYMGTARQTFIIDENGVISDIITKVKTKEHANQILGE